MEALSQSSQTDAAGTPFSLPPLLLQALLPGVTVVLPATKEQVLKYKEDQQHSFSQQRSRESAAVPATAAAARTEISGVALARALQLPVVLTGKPLGPDAACGDQLRVPGRETSGYSLSDGTAYVLPETDSCSRVEPSRESGAGEWVGSVIGGLGEVIPLPEPIWVQAGACPAAWLEQLVVQVALGVKAEMIKALEACAHTRVSKQEILISSVLYSLWELHGSYTF